MDICISIWEKSLQVGIPFAVNSLWEDVIFTILSLQQKIDDIFGRHTPVSLKYQYPPPRGTRMFKSVI